MFKKVYVLILAFAFVLAPFGGWLGHDVANAAKGRSFNSGGVKPSTPTTPSVKNNQGSSSTNSFKSAPVKSTSKGSFMKGLMFGGLAGLLLGSLFGNLGIWGAILGFLINAVAIIVMIVVAVKIYRLIQKRRRQQHKWVN